VVKDGNTPWQTSVQGGSGQNGIDAYPSGRLVDVEAATAVRTRGNFKDKSIRGVKLFPA